MRRLRALLAVAVAILTIGLAGCGSNVNTPPPTYTSEQVQMIQTYGAGLQRLRDRMPELQSYLDQKDWTNVQNFIHGPLGDLRSRLFRLSRTLLPAEQAEAAELARSLNNHLVRIDEAADTEDAVLAYREYRDALNDFDTILQLISSEI